MEAMMIETSEENPIPFLGTHNAVVTLNNPATGRHRTFRVSTVKKGSLEGKRVIGLLIGPDNSNDYQGFGFVDEFGQVKVWRKYLGTDGEKSEFERFADLFNRPLFYAAKGLEYMAEARCRRCGRRLSTPESLTLGLGPECATKV